MKKILFSMVILLIYVFYGIDQGFIDAPTSIKNFLSTILFSILDFSLILKNLFLEIANKNPKNTALIIIFGPIITVLVINFFVFLKKI